MRNTKIPLRPEHAEDLLFYEKALKHYQDELQKIVEEGKFLAELLDRLNGGQIAIHKLQIPYAGVSFLRCSQSVAMVIEQSHQNKKTEMEYRGLFASIQEALTLFLAQKYAIDPTGQWNLNTAAGYITQGDPDA